MPKENQRYRLIRFSLTGNLRGPALGEIEDFLNEADDDQYIHEIIKEGSQILIVMARRCRRMLRPTKTKRPAKKKAAKKKPAAKKKAK